MGEAAGSERVVSLERDGLSFDVFDEGPLDGDVVVLLHGFPERSTSWRHVVPLLHDAGYRTIAMDQRGYSPRARPARRRDYRGTELADDAAALVDLVGGRAHVVGHDWGAVVAWMLAMRHPERVRTLTAISVPHPVAFVRSWFTSTQGLKSWYMAMFQIPRAAEAAARKPGGIFDTSLANSGMSPDEVSRCRTEIVEYGALPGALGWYRALPFADRGMLHQTVTAPTTLIWSDGDVAVGRAGVDRTAAYVDAPYELVVLTGVTHWIPTQAAPACAEAILERLTTA